jgi:hypothetical protein
MRLKIRTPVPLFMSAIFCALVTRGRVHRIEKCKSPRRLARIAFHSRLHGELIDTQILPCLQLEYGSNVISLVEQRALAGRQEKAVLGRDLSMWRSRARLISGLVLFAFVLSHLAAHGFLLISFDRAGAAQAGRVS